MTQEISDDAPIPSKWTEHVDIPARPHAGGSIKEVQHSRAGALRADIAIPKNSENIDKFLKMFMARTKDILYAELNGCWNILK